MQRLTICIVIGIAVPVGQPVVATRSRQQAGRILIPRGRELAVVGGQAIGNQQRSAWLAAPLQGAAVGGLCGVVKRIHATQVAADFVMGFRQWRPGIKIGIGTGVRRQSVQCLLQPAQMLLTGNAGRDTSHLNQQPAARRFP